jgi:flavin-dependent dehydrogenase
VTDVVSVAIVGAGPAGARAAELLASEGVNVVIFDAKAPWEKPCGGALPAALFDESPDMAEVRSFAHRVERAHVEAGPGIGVDIRLTRPIWVVSRESLGRWQLARAVEAGAVHERAQVRALSRAPRGWVLATDRGAVHVGTVIGADGAASAVRRATAPGLHFDRTLARVEYPQRCEVAGDTLTLRFFADVAGYLWDFPRADHRSVGIEAEQSDATRAFLDAALDEHARAQGDDPGRRSGAVIPSKAVGRRRFADLGGADYALLGDAAGLADPFTGEGIRNAIRSASLLAEAHRSGAPDWTRAYARLARRAFARELAAAVVVKKLLEESGLGLFLLRRAVESERAHTCVGAILDSLLEHDYGVIRFLERWRARGRHGRPWPAAHGISSTTA